MLCDLQLFLTVSAGILGPADTPPHSRPETEGQAQTKAALNNEKLAAGGDTFQWRRLRRGSRRNMI